MNLLCRAKISGRLRLSPLYSIFSLQQSNSYSTSKTPKPTYPKSHKSPVPSSSFSERIKKPTGNAIVWPKPSEIPYQAKVANFVNLIGYVKAPVQFETASDGKHFAATSISAEVFGRKEPLLIPVVFEGDLAHVVASHVKENDCVLVSGQLSSDPLRFALKEGFGKFHVVCENLNFVEGFKRGDSKKKYGGSFSGVGIEKAADGGIENAVKGVDDEKFDQRWEEALEEAKVKKFSGEANWGLGSVPLEGAIRGGGEAKLERVSAKSGDSGVKKKDGDRIADLWRDLVKNSLLWWDYRDQKAKGLVKEKFPDFKHKETDDGLWISSAPKWVLPGLGKLEFDVPVVKTKVVRKSSGRDDDSWKDLVENPGKWWDNRSKKRHPKAPDFKEKETGKALWLDSAPDWALSRLPSSK